MTGIKVRNEKRLFIMNNISWERFTIFAMKYFMSDMIGNSYTKTGNGDLFKISFAGYTFRHFDLDTTLEMMQKMDARYLCIKDFHLPYKSTDEEIAAFHAKLAAKKVTGYGVGPIYMTTEAEADERFDYARRAGMKLIVGVPNYELLPYVEKKVKEYNVHYAIHIHGPDKDLYPNATDVIKHVKNLDPRIGVCLDIAHTTRDGLDPVSDLKKYYERIFDIHLNDATEAKKEGQLCELGRGIIDIPAFVRELRRLKYNGACSIELTANKENTYAAAAESIGYIRGVADVTK
jgi:sugar phosphate isomerase/epimerase